MNYYGVDPGKHGAMSVIYEDGTIRSIPFDRDAFVAEFAEASLHDSFCVLERVNAMPGQGVVSMFSFGENYGWIQGVLEANGIPYQLITPQRWKKEFGVTRDKNTSIAVAKRMFPGHDFRRTERSRVDDDGIAESALIALYAKRISNG